MRWAQEPERLMVLPDGALFIAGGVLAGEPDEVGGAYGWVCRWAQAEAERRGLYDQHVAALPEEAAAWLAQQT